MIILKDVYKAFDEKIILNKINLEIEDNKIVGLFGINGAGKTTLMRMLSSVYDTNIGTIFFDGVDVKKEKADIFFLSEDMNFSNTLVSKIVESYKLFYKKFDYDYFKELILKCELNEKDKIVSYSKGMKKKLGLCLALASNSKYILIDEAFDGVDTIAKNEFKELFFNYIEKNNATIIITSHSINDLDDLIDKIVVINKNEIILDSFYNDVIDKYIKYQLAFDDDIDISKIKELNPILMKQNGKFIDLIFEKDKEDIDKINNLDAKFINQTNVNYQELLEALMKGEFKND